jgi:hypothetical protein
MNRNIEDDTHQDGGQADGEPIPAKGRVHTADDPFSGAHVDTYCDEEASAQARRAAPVGDDFIPIDDPRAVEARLRVASTQEARDRIAFDPALLLALARRRLSGDMLTFSQVRRVCKAAGVRMADWDAALKRREEEARDQAEADDRRQRAEQARDERFRSEAQREQREREARSALDDLRSTYPIELRPYVDTFPASDGIVIEMRPGETFAMVSKTRSGELRPQPARVHLINAAPRLLVVTRDYLLPNQPPSVTFRVGLALARNEVCTYEGDPTEIENGRWIPIASAGAAVLSPGPEVKELFRVALGYTASAAQTVVRRRYLGWIFEGGRWLRVHARGAIGAEGEVAGYAPAGLDEKLRRYALPPPPLGEARDRALLILVELLSLTPSGVVLPLVAFVVRSMMGPGAGLMNVVGLSGLGKTTIIVIALNLVGEFGEARCIPGSWEYDTTASLLRNLAIAGDLPYAIDDWRPQSDQGGKKFLGIARSLFNLAGRGALDRTRQDNSTPPPRSSGLSSSEAEPREVSFSGMSRVASIELTEAVALPGAVYADDGHTRDDQVFIRYAPRALNGAGALLTQWMASRLERWRDPSDLASLERLTSAERGALADLDLAVTARAADVIRPVALGATTLLEFLRETRAIDEHALAVLRSRYTDVLKGMIENRRTSLEQTKTGLVILRRIAQLMRSRSANAVLVRDGRVLEDPPPDAWRYGWSTENGVPRSYGPRIAYYDDRYREALCLDPDAVVAVLSRSARGDGEEPVVRDESHLRRELTAAGVLVARESAKRASVRTRVDGAVRARLVVALSAFDFPLSDEDAQSSGAEASVEADSEW